MATPVTDEVRALLPQEATRLDDPPLYCIYSGSIQGIWKDSRYVPLILSTLGGHCGCLVYSWTEAIYTRASGQSFKDILLAEGWDRLRAVLLELFRSEEQFVLSPQLVVHLRGIPNSPLSLTKALRRFSESSWARLQPFPAPQPRRSPSWPRQMLFAKPWDAELTTHYLGAINSDVIDRMYLVYSSIRDKPLSEAVETHEGAPTTLSSRRAKLLKLNEDDFFYNDYVQSVNRTANLTNNIQTSEVDSDDGTVDI